MSAADQPAEPTQKLAHVRLLFGGVEDEAHRALEGLPPVALLHQFLPAEAGQRLFGLRSNLWLGGEILLADSDDSLRTSMSYQAAGPVVQVSYGESWFISGGVHAGGVNVNAMARRGEAPSTGAATGSFFNVSFGL